MVEKKEDIQADLLRSYEQEIQNLRNDNINLSVPSSTRKAIHSRFRKMGSECLQFETCIQAIKAKNQTGAPKEEDIERTALVIFNKATTIGNIYSFLSDCELDIGPPFPHKSALRVLRSTYTWNVIIKSQQATKHNSNDTEMGVSVSEDIDAEEPT